MHHDLEREKLIAERLRALPDAQPPYDWAEFQRHVQARAAAASYGAPRLRALRMATALAAGVVLLIVGVAFWDKFPLDLGSAHPERMTRSTAQPPPSRPEAASVREAQVAQIEGWLASLPDDPPLVRVGTRAAVVGLEDRIAQLDDELSAERVLEARPARLNALQQQRAQLVSSLAQVRYAESLAAVSR